eukprot:scaffold27502_cov15-Tisochrysis_lutea.AAC.1
MQPGVSLAFARLCLEVPALRCLCYDGPEMPALGACAELSTSARSWCSQKGSLTEWASCLHPTFVQGCSRTGILPQSYLDTCARSWCSKRCSHAGMLPSHTGAHWQASCLSLTSILQRACSAHKEAR